MNENLTILKKGLVLIAVPFLVQLAFLGLLLKTHADGARAQRSALHSKEVIARVEGVFRGLSEAQGGILGLLLTGDPAFYEHAERTLREVLPELEGLERLVADDPSQQARARDIAARAKDLIAWHGEAARLIRAGRREEAVDQMKGRGGKTPLVAVRDAIDAFLREEERLDAERMAILARASRRQAWTLAVGGVLAVLGIFVLAAAFGRGITRRFATLVENAGRLAEGKELARPLTGRDEIAQVDRVFHGMARAIAEKNRENEMFIYSVSHDLRSPLVNLQGFSQELGHAARDLRGLIEAADLPAATRARARALLDQDVAGSIQFIQTAVSRLSAIIDALLRLSRAGRVEYRWQPVDVAATVDRVVEALGSTIAERGARVTSADLPEAWGDPTAVEQVFANLIGNAVNYLDPGRPGVIEVGALDGTPAPASMPTSMSMPMSVPVPIRTYYVKDNGRGIPEAGMAKLFHAFQRFHDGAARGEGIGLALVRRIVERHGGKIRVESATGVGSTFFVDLPAGPTDAAAQPPPTFEGKGTFA